MSSGAAAGIGRCWTARAAMEATSMSGWFTTAGWSCSCTASTWSTTTGGSAIPRRARTATASRSGSNSMTSTPPFGERRRSGPMWYGRRTATRRTAPAAPTTASSGCATRTATWWCWRVRTASRPGPIRASPNSPAGAQCVVAHARERANHPASSPCSHGTTRRRVPPMPPPEIAHSASDDLGAIAIACRRTRKRGSGLSCGDDFADPAFRAALEQGDDVLAHPGTAHLARDAIGVFCARKGEYQHQVLLADHRDVGSDPAGIDDALDDVLQLVSSRLRERVAQAQVVDDDMHAADATGASDAERGVLSSTEGMLSPRGSGDSPAELGPVIAS